MSPRVLFEQDLETLKNKVSEMGEHAEISYDRMVYGIRENKEDILKTLLDTDHTMVDMQRSIEAMCLSLLTRQQPVARDMRLVSAALKVVTDIERIGDHATNVAEWVEFSITGERPVMTKYTFDQKTMEEKKLARDERVFKRVQ